MTDSRVPEPPITDELRAQAQRQPGGWLYSIDPAYNPDGQVPPYAIIGAWQVDDQGRISGFKHNGNYRPSARALGWPEPGDPVEAAMQKAATGHSGDDDVLTALGSHPLLLFAPEGQTSGPLHLRQLPGGRDTLDVFTDPRWLPPGWSSWQRLTGQQIAQAVADCDLRINPGSPLTVAVPVKALAGHAPDRAARLRGAWNQLGR